LRATVALPLLPRIIADKPLFQARSLNHIAIGVSDLSRSRAFYQKTLGLTEYREADTNLQLGPIGKSFIGLTKNGKAGTIDHACFGIDGYELNAVVDKLKRAGLNPEVRTGQLYFRDPDGAQLQLDSVNYTGSAPEMKSPRKETSAIFQARNFSHIQIGVTDMKRSRDFYQNMLGLSLLKEEPPNTVLMTIDGYQFLSLSNASNQKPGNIDHFCVSVDGFTTDSALAALKRSAPELKATQARNEFVFFNDPDGTRVQLANNEYKG